MPQNTFAAQLRDLATKWEENMLVLEKHADALEALWEYYYDLPDYAIVRNHTDDIDGCFTFDEWIAESSVVMDSSLMCFPVNAQEPIVFDGKCWAEIE
jgi:hypothetical protein